MPSEQSRVQRLHPLSLVRDLPVRELLGGAVPLVVAAGALDLLILVPLGALGLIVVATAQFLLWRAHTYELTPDAVIERRGVLNRRERVVELARIQQVELTRTLLDRLVGTAEVRVETASDAGESELQLRVVAEGEARRLRARLRPGPDRRDEQPDEETDRALLRVPAAHAALAAVTGSRLLVVPLLVLGLVGVLQDLQLLQRGARTVGTLATSLGVIAVVVGALFATAVGVAAAAVVGVVRDGGFVIMERDSDLHVSRGLLATREAVIPRGRIQQVTVRRSWIRRLLGYATVSLHSAGGSGRDTEAGERRTLTVPLLPEEAVEDTVATLLGHRPLPDLEPHPATALRRAIVRWLWRVGIVALVPAGVLVPLSPQVAVGVVVAALLAAPVIGLLDFRHRASGASTRLVAGRSGALNTATGITPRRKSQATTVASSPFQRRLGLATLHVHVAGAGGLALRDLDDPRARRLADGLLPASAPAGG